MALCSDRTVAYCQLLARHGQLSSCTSRIFAASSGHITVNSPLSVTVAMLCSASNLPAVGRKPGVPQGQHRHESRPAITRP